MWLHTQQPRKLPFKVAYEENSLQPAHLDLREAHSTLEVNQYGEDLAKKLE